MPRNLALVALALMLLTGLVLGQMSALNRTTAPIAATTDDGSAGTARAFYGAINLFLDTGDARSVARFLAPGFTGHSTHAAGDESAEDLMQYLESLRLTFPGLRLEVNNLSARGGTVAVDVKLTGEATGSFAGLPLNAGPSVRGYEVLRIEGDQVAERWASRELPPMFQAIAAAELPFPSKAFPDPQIDRLTIGPNGFGEFVDTDGFVLVAESGEVIFEVERLPDERSTPAGTLDDDARSDLPEIGEQVALSPFESVVAPPGIRYRIGNNTQTSVTALIVAIRRAQFGPTAGNFSAYQVVESVGVERTALSDGGMDHAPHEAGIISVAIGRAVLPPGAEIPSHETGAAELLVMEAGSIEAIVHSGRLLWTTPGMSFGIEDDLETLNAGQGGRIEQGSVVEYRATYDGPATIWIVTIQTDGAEVST
jgi:predicted ester cyclase